jgi:hypothetical protein
MHFRRTLPQFAAVDKTADAGSRIIAPQLRMVWPKAVYPRGIGCVSASGWIIDGGSGLPSWLARAAIWRFRRRMAAADAAKMGERSAA